MKQAFLLVSLAGGVAGAAVNCIANLPSAEANDVISLAGCKMLNPAADEWHCTGTTAFPTTAGTLCYAVNASAGEALANTTNATSMLATEVCPTHVDGDYVTGVKGGVSGASNDCTTIAARCPGNSVNAAHCISCAAANDMDEPHKTCQDGAVVSTQCNQGDNAATCSCRSAWNSYTAGVTSGSVFTCDKQLWEGDVAAATTGPVANSVVATSAQAHSWVTTAGAPTALGSGTIAVYDGSAYSTADECATFENISSACYCRTGNAATGTAAGATFAEVAANFTKVAGTGSDTGCDKMCIAPASADKVWVKETSNTTCNKCPDGEALSDTKGCIYTHSTTTYASKSLCATPDADDCICGTAYRASGASGRCDLVACANNEDYTQCSACGSTTMTVGAMCTVSSADPPVSVMKSACADAGTDCVCHEGDGTSNLVDDDTECATAKGAACTTGTNILLAKGPGITLDAFFTSEETSKTCGRCAAAAFANYDMDAKTDFCIQDSADSTKNAIVQKCSSASPTGDCVCFEVGAMTKKKSGDTCTMAKCPGNGETQDTCRSCVTAGTYDMQAGHFCVKDSADATTNALIQACADSTTEASGNGCMCEGKTTTTHITTGMCTEHGASCADATNPIIAAGACNTCVASADLKSPAANQDYCYHDASLSTPASKILPKCAAGTADADCICEAGDKPMFVASGDECSLAKCTVAANEGTTECSRCVADDSAYDMDGNLCANDGTNNKRVAACDAVTATGECVCLATDMKGALIATGTVCNGCSDLTKKGEIMPGKEDTCEQCGVTAMVTGQACHMKAAAEFVVLAVCNDGDTATEDAGCACKGSDDVHYLVAKDKKCDAKKKGKSAGGSSSSANALLSGLALTLVVLFKA